MIDNDKINENLIEINPVQNNNAELSKSIDKKHKVQTSPSIFKSDKFETKKPSEKIFVDIEKLTQCTFEVTSQQNTSKIEGSNSDISPQICDSISRTQNRKVEPIRRSESTRNERNEDNHHSDDNIKIECDDFINLDKLIELGSHNFCNDYNEQNLDSEDDSLDNCDNSYDLTFDHKIPSTNSATEPQEYLLAYHSTEPDFTTNEEYISNFKCDFTLLYESEYASKYSAIVDHCMSTDSKKIWARLDGISVHNDVLEYAHYNDDVGLAQALEPFTMEYNYFELEILDEGQKTAIAIGATKRDYPIHQHPGWCEGSIAYHADDGKIFIGQGIGDRFGPISKKGDRMGCGIIFPRRYNPKYDTTDHKSASNSDEDEKDFLQKIIQPPDGDENIVEERRIEKERQHRQLMQMIWNGEDLLDEDEMYNDPQMDFVPERNDEADGTAVEVYFTRNGEMVGSKWTHIPKGGFFPTIGMLSQKEKVRVFLRPMTG